MRHGWKAQPKEGDAPRPSVGREAELKVFLAPEAHGPLPADPPRVGLALEDGAEGEIPPVGGGARYCYLLEIYIFHHEERGYASG